MTVNAALGEADVINFQPTGAARLLSPATFRHRRRVNTLIRALRAGDIEVTAIHSHMLNEKSSALLHSFLGQ
jgi:hypothetical protein